jgi:hypothetical protein
VNRLLAPRFCQESVKNRLWDPRTFFRTSSRNGSHREAGSAVRRCGQSRVRFYRLNATSTVDRAAAVVVCVRYATSTLPEHRPVCSQGVDDQSSHTGGYLRIAKKPNDGASTSRNGIRSSGRPRVTSRTQTHHATYWERRTSVPGRARVTCLTGWLPHVGGFPRNRDKSLARRGGDDAPPGRSDRSEVGSAASIEGSARTAHLFKSAEHAGCGTGTRVFVRRDPEATRGDEPEQHDAAMNWTST